MKFYERSLQALLSSAPRGLAARSRIFVRLASLAQTGELARILCCLKRVKKKIKAICTVLISCTVCVYFGYELKFYRQASVKQVSRLPRGWCGDGGRGHDFQKIAHLSALTGKKQNIWQLLNEAEKDVKNYADRGGCYDNIIPYLIFF